MATTYSEKAYLPAAGQHWRLPFYDLMAKLVGADSARRALVDQIALAPGDRVLDIGSGTGSLAIALKRRHTSADVVGLDPDPRALAIARRKAQRASLAIRFDQGFADDLPYPDASFDRVTSSLMFHHLSSADKEQALREIHRVLQPGGRFHMLDFDGPLPAGHGGLLTRLTRHLHAHTQLRDNAEDRVLASMNAAGFPDARLVARRSGRFVQMCYYEALRR
jgi:ubiquinone/menaquinone biosynthesis C-methylase UbiE